MSYRVRLVWDFFQERTEKQTLLPHVLLTPCTVSRSPPTFLEDFSALHSFIQPHHRDAESLWLRL